MSADMALRFHRAFSAVIDRRYRYGIWPPNAKAKLPGIPCNGDRIDPQLPAKSRQRRDFVLKGAPFARFVRQR
jgi:hypothetical protein